MGRTILVGVGLLCACKDELRRCALDADCVGGVCSSIGICVAVDAGPGVDGGEVDAGPVDAGPENPGLTDGGVCDPILNVGCAPGRRCGILRGATRDFLQCVVMSDGGIGAECDYVPDERPDTCAPGLTCGPYGCTPICDLSGDVGRCGAGAKCAVAFYTSSGPSVIGSCRPTCDVVTQRRLIDDAGFCGSPNPAAPRYGCVGSPGAGWCDNAGPSNRTYRTPANSPLRPNDCAAGFLPYLPASTGSSIFVCTRFCRPLEAYSGFAPTGGEYPYDCVSLGAPASAECRFYWWLGGEPGSDIGNTVGVCYDPNFYTWDDDNDLMTPPVATPSCRTLERGYDGGLLVHQQWGCAPFP